MKYTSKKENLMLYKVLFMICTIIAYIIGKSLPLFMIDVAAYSASPPYSCAKTANTDWQGMAICIAITEGASA